MSWGGGGGMFGAGGGGMFGGGNANRANANSGLPFAGIPSEFREFVATLAESEEDDTRPVATFTQHAEDRRPLNLRRMFAPHWKVMLVAPVLVVIEAVTLQAGPILVQIGIDHGIRDQNATVIVAVGIAPVLAVVATIAAARGRLRTTGRVSAEVMHGARVRLFAHLQRLSLDYTGEKAGVIMSRMTSDIENLQQLTQEGSSSSRCKA